MLGYLVLVPNQGTQCIGISKNRRPYRYIGTGDDLIGLQIVLGRCEIVVDQNRKVATLYWTLNLISEKLSISCIGGSYFLK